jgi:hypothetical protein
MLVRCPIFPLVTTGTVAFERGFGGGRLSGCLRHLRVPSTVCDIGKQEDISPCCRPALSQSKPPLVASPNRAMRAIQVDRNIVSGSNAPTDCRAPQRHIYRRHDKIGELTGRAGY